MIETRPIRDIIKLVLASCYILDESAVSLLLIALPESGKTMSMKEFSQVDGVQWLSDVTLLGLVDIIREIATTGNPKTLFFPDLTKQLGRNPTVSENMVTLLNELVEEGVGDLKIGPTIREHFNPLVRVNIVGAITQTELFEKLDFLDRIGFLSRVAPFSYKYSLDQIKKIMADVMMGNHSATEYQRLFRRKNRVPKSHRVTMQEKFATQVKENITDLIKSNFILGSFREQYGFRIQRNLQTLTKAHAWLDGRSRVNQADVDHLVGLGRWLNYSFRALEVPITETKQN